jgi:hypothetical protein
MERLVKLVDEHALLAEHPLGLSDGVARLAHEDARSCRKTSKRERARLTDGDETSRRKTSPAQTIAYC